MPVEQVANVLVLSWCNRGQLEGVVQVILTPLISRCALATDARGCGLLSVETVVSGTGGVTHTCS